MCARGAREEALAAAAPRDRQRPLAHRHRSQSDAHSATRATRAPSPTSRQRRARPPPKPRRTALRPVLHTSRREPKARVRGPYIIKQMHLQQETILELLSLNLQVIYTLIHIDGRVHEYTEGEQNFTVENL